MYSQNIDTLEQKAGISNVLQCHGSFATATCTDPACGYKADGRTIRDDLLAKRIPPCPQCTMRREAREVGRRAKRRKVSDQWKEDETSDDEAQEVAYGIMKPDITFFGEKLPDAFDWCVFADRDKVDLILVMGTSLKVAPVADLLTHLPPTVPTVLINRTPITHMAMDVMLLGDSDQIVQHLCHKLGWAGASDTVQPPERVGESHVYQFPGAEGGWYVAQLSGKEPADASADLDAEPDEERSDSRRSSLASPAGPSAPE